MIDFLSNPSWVGPQIDFLLFLQNFRISFPEIIDKFFLSITIFGEFWLPTLVCAIVYWCIDFRAGVYLFSLESFNILLAHLFKMIACVYRPWVLDSQVQPSKLAVPFAKGYSFPSGHSAMSSSVLGGVAYLVRKNKLFCTFLICLILMIGFSRLWLGVHTPQDVVVGLSIGLVLVFAVNGLINWAEKDKNRYLYLLGGINIVAILALIYICYLGTYRIDYISGELLVNPLKQKYVTAVVYGYALGLVNGSFLCRRFFPFEPKEVSIKRRVTRGIVGAIGIILLLKFILEPIIMKALDLRISIFLMFLLGILVTLIYPIIFKSFGNRKIKLL
ncbi:phosphatase PAP2 family protein [bacterium]|nr:phosphatase PAP2 family protein [bacterium]